MALGHVFATAFLVIGAGVAGVAFGFYRKRRAFVESSVVTTGTIVELREDPSPSETESACFPRVRFQTSNGRTVTFESNAGGAAAIFPIGSQVAVRYPTDRPESAEVDNIGSLWGPTIVLAALAVVFLAVAAGLWSGAIPP